MNGHLRILKHHANTDSFGTNKQGETTLRWEYFYRHGRSAESYATSVQKIIDAHSLNLMIIDSGDHWAAFRGGASTRNSSHFYVTVKAKTVVDIDPRLV